MSGLLTNIQEIDDDIKRNIVSLIKSEDLFDDLHDGDLESQKIAQAMEANIKKEIPLGLISRGFHYTTAIGFPFDSENYQQTRYSDGSFGCWYGSKDLDTSIFETAYHSLNDVMNIDGMTEIIHRERAVYNIHCKAVLVDFVCKAKDYPQLTVDDYTFTQKIGKQLASGGPPGLMAPSARKPKGINIVAFDERILSSPRFSCNLIYKIDPNNQTVSVEKKEGTKYLSIDFAR